MNQPVKKIFVPVSLAVLLLASASATDLRNVETVTPYSSNDIQIEGDVDMGSNNILSTGLIDGIDLDDPGNGLTESSNSYAVASNSIYTDELNLGDVDQRYLLESGDKLGGDLKMNGNDLEDSGTVIWDTSNSYIPSGRVQTSGLDADTLDGTELTNIDWGDTAMDENDVSASNVGLGNVRNVDLNNAAGSYLGYNTNNENFNVDASSILGTGNDFDSNGNLGSNTVGNAELDNTDQFTFSDESGGPMVQLQGGDNGYEGLDISMDDDNTNNNYGLRVRFEDSSGWDTSGDVAFTVQPNENDHRVGINTNSPGSTLDVGGGTISGIGGLNNCNNDEALLGDGSCGQAGNTAQRDLTTSNGLTGGQNNVLVGTDSDVDISISSGGVNTNEIASSAVTTTEISDGTITTDDFNTGDIDSSYLRRDGTNYMQGDLDLNDNNITDSAGGNITLSQDLKVYGKVWTPQTGEGGSETSSGLAKVLENNNSAGSNNIDLSGNNITDNQKGNVTIGQDLKLYGDLWLPGDGTGEGGGTSTLAETLENNNSAGSNNIDMDQNQVKNVVIDKRDCSDGGNAPSNPKVGQMWYCTNAD